MADLQMLTFETHVQYINVIDYCLCLLGDIYLWLGGFTPEWHTQWGRAKGDSLVSMPSALGDA